jgi:hypothetical protein
MSEGGFSPEGGVPTYQPKVEINDVTTEKFGDNSEPDWAKGGSKEPNNGEERPLNFSNPQEALKKMAPEPKKMEKLKI